MTDLNAWYYCYQTCSAQIPATAITGIKGTPLVGTGSISGSGSHSLLCGLLCMSAGHTSKCFLFHFSTFFTPVDWIPHPSGAQLVGFPAGSCCLPVQFSFHHNLGMLPYTHWKFSLAQLTSFQQAELTCPLPCLYVSLAGIQINTVFSIIWEYSRLWWSY